MFRMKKTIVFLFILFAFFTLASAQEGCFTFPDSPLFCETISLGEAQQECSSFSDCNMERDFFQGKSCTNLSQFPACQKVLCKSSCTFQYSGRCSAGEIPEKEAESWCASGCCWFKHSEEIYCGEQLTKWRCQVQAYNKGAPDFGYDAQAESDRCKTFCTTLTTLNYDQGSLEKVPSFLPNASPILVYPSSTSLDSSISEKTETSFSVWWILLLPLLLIIIIGIKLLHSKPSFLEDLVQRWEEVPLVSSSPINEEKVKSGKSKLHQQKVRQRTKFFLSTGMEPEKVTTKISLFTRIKRLVKRSPPKILSTKKTMPEKSSLDRLTEITSHKVKEAKGEESIPRNPSFSSTLSSPPPPSSAKEERSSLFSRLSQISRKK